MPRYDDEMAGSGQLLPEGDLQLGLDSLRRGAFLNASSINTLRYNAQLEYREFPARFLPPGTPPRAPLTDAEQAIKMRIEDAVATCTIDWDHFQVVIDAIYNRQVMFIWKVLYALPIVTELCERYVHNELNLWDYIVRASNQNERSYQPIRDMFANASTADRPHIIQLLGAHEALQLRERNDPMVTAHCDKWTAYQALRLEFSAVLKG